MLRLVVVGIVVVLAILAQDASAGRTIKKHSALIRKTTVAPAISDEEDPTLQKEGKSELSETSAAPGEKLECEDGQCEASPPPPPPPKKKKKPIEKTPTASSSTAVATQPQPQQPYPYQAHPFRPMNLYQYYYGNRLRTSVPHTPHYTNAHRLLPHLQQATLDMARGILSGFGWELESWELVLLESIVKTVCKDFLFLFNMFL